MIVSTEFMVEVDRQLTSFHHLVVMVCCLVSQDNLVFRKIKEAHPEPSFFDDCDCTISKLIKDVRRQLKEVSYPSPDCDPKTGVPYGDLA